jgi:hypothetical protein
VPPGKIGHFAGEARVTDVADMRKVTEDKRLTLIASLVHMAAIGVRDDVVTMFCKRMAAIQKRGRDHLEALREAHRAESERLLGVFGDVLSVVQEAMTPVGPGGDIVVPDGPAPRGRPHTPATNTAAPIRHRLPDFLTEFDGVVDAVVVPLDQ